MRIMLGAPAWHAALPRPPRETQRPGHRQERPPGRVHGHLVKDVKSLAKVLPALGARIVALAVPASAAQGAADAAIAGGARWILNFAPTHIKTPTNCLVRDVSFTQEFAVLAHYSEDK